MTPDPAKLALGHLIEALSSCVFDFQTLDHVDCQDLLLVAGLAVERPATAAECAENSDHEPGDLICELTPLARECRELVRKARSMSA